tara:strand:+ start:83 stop:547 length:465 start_codon:yes stop_codon:yes gene_type:complete
MDIIGFPDYLIYPDGRVFGKKYKKIKIPQKKGGYLYVGLYNKRKLKNKLIHRLIAEHYIPNPGNKPTVDHINRNREDNIIENLRWATRIEQNANQGLLKRNKSGHKYISWNKSYNGWRFLKQGAGEGANRYFKSKIDCICYKYIYLLKIKSKII